MVPGAHPRPERRGPQQGRAVDGVAAAAPRAPWPSFADLAADHGTALCAADRRGAGPTITEDRPSAPLEQRADSSSFTQASDADNGDVDSIANLALARQRRQQRAEQLGVRGQAAARSSSATAQGSYIPVCTRNVFLKYYTDGRRPADPLLGRRRTARPTSTRSSHRGAVRAHTSTAGGGRRREGLPRRRFDGAVRAAAPTTPPAVTAHRDPADPARLRAGAARTRTVDEIRSNFLDVLHDAVTGGEPVGLDFVYGEVDGRHAATARRPAAPHHAVPPALVPRVPRRSAGRRRTAWKRFTYATRPSARLFCERLVAAPLPADEPSARPRGSPTSPGTSTRGGSTRRSSRCSVIDAIDERFADDGSRRQPGRGSPTRARRRSRSTCCPSSEMGAGEDLYIKMNSRGKPLTAFETFKAHFEQTLAESTRTRATTFAHKIDGAWSDLLWPFRGDDDIVDDEFMRYFDFVTEVCEWRDRAESTSGPLERRAGPCLVADNPAATDHLNFLFAAFDCWIGRDLTSGFRQLVCHLAAMPSMIPAAGGPGGPATRRTCSRHVLPLLRVDCAAKPESFTFGRGYCCTACSCT